ncbi:hypothetical protein KJ980_07950 [Patescibacteria group bacterium]|nr:hypothetical protein [Patescibacteria group bacterium]MBU4017115.1 hypothetical protein [Patescibacteria group bacterium]MBU4099551.1 hypothetical protein [Patescibacteria group bacterium]
MNEIIKQAPQIVPVLTDPANLWVSVGLAVVTFFALVVALFQERIRKYWNRAVLDMEINLIPPDCHQISLSNQQGEIVGQTIYIRIKVLHKNGSAGENVEIMPIHFWRVGENKLSVLKHFLPINLVWSHFQPRTNTIRVPVSLFRHCDFGHFIKSQNGDKAILFLDTMVQPNPVADGEIPNVIKPGKYQFELLLSGDNVKALRKKWELEFEKWSYDENEMLNRNIRFKEVK